MRHFRVPRFLLLLPIIICISIVANAQQNSEALKLVTRYTKQLGLPATENEYTISNTYKDQSSGLTYVYIQQQYKGIKVFNQIISAAFKNDQLLYKSGLFIQGMETKASSAFPLVDALTAVGKASTHLKIESPVGLQVVSDLMNLEKRIVLNSGTISRQNIVADLLWVPSEDGISVRLSWNVNIDVKGKNDWWNVRVDALNGTIISQDNWTVNEQLPTTRRTNGLGKPRVMPLMNSGNRFFAPGVTNASYNVIPFPAENKNVTGPTVENNPWLKAGTGNNAITNGWHYDGTTDYDITRGNNVYAYTDVSATNTPGGANVTSTSTTAIPTLTFNFAPNFSQDPSNSSNQNFALTNLFYWNNMMHDVFYQYGFDEVAGNFQASNMGRGGSGNDYVQAEAQDGGGSNNANFATPGDGVRPRMQMYLFDGATVCNVSSPASIAGNYYAVESNFSNANWLVNVGAINSQLVYYNDDASGLTHEACNGAPANSVVGKIVLIDRGTCSFVVKVKNAQDAGAMGVIVVNNVAGLPLIMGGTDNSIIIPAVMISKSDGLILAAQLANNVNVTLSAGPNLDGDIDNGIVTHEYGHGISNRLTGGPANSSCLNNKEQGGEGWSDYVALMMTTNWSTTALNDSTVPRAVGNYAVGLPNTGSGIRRYPYSYNMTTDPLTYANMDGTTTGGEVHNIGEIWCSALWDMTWNIIKQTGSITPQLHNGAGTGGNVIALKLVLQGMKLQPCSPGFLDSRDAILAADSILYNYAHKCAIWNAFARRGMGYSAKQGSSNSTSDHTPAFDVPSGVTLTKNISPVSVANAASYTVNLQANCGCAVPLNNYKITDTIPAGFSYSSSSSGGVLNGTAVNFAGINFTTAQEVKNFSITITATGAACAIDSVINDNRDTKTVGGLTATSLLSANSWAESSVSAYAGSKSWNGGDPTDTSDFVLTSAAFTVQPMTMLSFWHKYDFESGYDGGRVEISTDGGTNWINAEPYIFQNTYNTAMSAGPWPIGEKSYSGSTGGQYINTLINLVPFNGQSIKIRFRVRTDTGNPSTLGGWFVDNILALRGCGGFSKAMVFNNAGVKLDSIMQPIFINSVVTAIPEPVIANNSIRIYPNPAANNTQISFHLTAKNQTTVSVTNLNGQKLLSYNRGTLVPGDYTQLIPVKQLAAGTYFVLIEAGGKRLYKKIVVVH